MFLIDTNVIFELSKPLPSAAVYGQLAARQQQNGRACSTEDAMIAAIALTNKLVLVTRNTKDFDGVSLLRVVDPWATQSV